MSLYKRGSIYWIELKTPQGKRVRESTGSSVRSVAQQYHDKRKVQIDRGVVDAPLTWDNAIDKWFAVKSAEKRPSSIESDRTIAAWFSKHLKGKTLGQVTEEVIHDLLRRKLEKTSPATTNRHLAFVKALFNLLVEHGWEVEPIKIKPWKEGNKRIRFLSEDEIARLMRQLPDHLKPVVEFSLLTGLRKSNVENLKWSQLDLKRGMLWIDGDDFKTGHNHGLPLSQRALEIIQEQSGKHREWVFTYNGGKASRVNGKAWRNALERAGIKDFRWHDLRHTFASYHAMNGTPLLTLKMLGGWQTVEMVNRYAHLSAEGARQYVENTIPVSVS